MPAKKPNETKASGPYFASVAVVVADAEKALEWYTTRLGLDLIDREEHWITVGRKGRPGVLHLCEPSGDDAASQLEPGNSGILLLLPGKDFEAGCATLKARGVEFTEGPTKADWGTYAVIRDPDGNEHSLMPAG
ncbi:MAG TPA: VOC family protein [Thermoplasmata archaeon]|nr:VOC family protein [Thermoplasmata archaeon]